MGDNAIKILAIDDIQDNLISLNALIKEKFPEVQIFTALNGEAGIALATVEDPDVILLDIVMPGINGFDVCKRLKSTKKLSDTPVVFFTALKGNRETRIRALEAGAEGFLAKPIDESELTAQIRAMAKIKAANIEKRDENKRLSALVAEQTSELRSAHAATLRLLEDLHLENETRKKSEKILCEREAFLNKLLETIPAPIYYKDLNARYSGCNQYFADFFGKNVDEVIGKNVFDVHPTELAKIYHAKDALLLQEPLTQTFESQVQNSMGLVRDVVYHKASLTDAQGAVTGLIGVIIDITARKSAEEENKCLQAKLLQAQKMESIGTLAGGIAHDFNNILGAILGYTEMAKDAIPPDSFAAKSLNKVMEASQRAASLVKQILAFSRQANLERVPLEPSHVVEETIKLLRPSLPSTIAINLSMDTANRLILADPTQVHQILMNLCTNAFHAMEQTGGTLEIILEDRELFQENLRYQPEVQPGKFVSLSVGDTGLGIEADIREKIFDPYFTTKEVGKGTGMGLAIAHGIVASYGGFITCESEIGRGTVFQVFFPAIEEGLTPEVKPLEGAPPGTERIFFIDDEEMLADLGKTMLERLGYDVTVRTSSLEALTIFRNQPERFDAVITDQTMSGLTGMDLARQILQIRPDIPIILCTGYSTLISEEQAKAQGIKGFVMKPMSKKVIATLLRKVLDESRMVS
jgi:PAS domain S-box-containing protein